MTPPDKTRETGLAIAKRTLARIKGPTMIHFASGRVGPVVEDLVETGAAIVGASCLDDLAELSKRCHGRLAVAGNLNGIEMRRWTQQDAEREVRRAIAQAAPGGGFLLADNHGEIPWQVGDAVLQAISEAVRSWGTYPIKPSVGDV